MIEPYLPPAKCIGRPSGWPLREIVNGIFYIMRCGCPWRHLPAERDLEIEVMKEVAAKKLVSVPATRWRV